jgi:hypothetical protein
VHLNLKVSKKNWFLISNSFVSPDNIKSSPTNWHKEMAIWSYFLATVSQKGKKVNPAQL